VFQTQNFVGTYRKGFKILLKCDIPLYFKLKILSVRPEYVLRFFLKKFDIPLCLNLKFGRYVRTGFKILLKFDITLCFKLKIFVGTSRTGFEILLKFDIPLCFNSKFLSVRS
jgi:hypothetical protein